MCVCVTTALIITPCILYYCTCPITLHFLYLMDIHEIRCDSLVEYIYMAMADVIVLFPHTHAVIHTCTWGHKHTPSHTSP